MSFVCLFREKDRRFNFHVEVKAPETIISTLLLQGIVLLMEKYIVSKIKDSDTKRLKISKIKDSNSRIIVYFTIQDGREGRAYHYFTGLSLLLPAAPFQLSASKRVQCYDSDEQHVQGLSALLSNAKPSIEVEATFQWDPCSVAFP
jgi:hypothetical protein